MRPAKAALAGAGFGLLLALMLGVVTFGIGMAQESVYTIPYLWRGGVEEVADGFEFVVAPHGGGILAVIAGSALVGLALGARSRSRA